ncbi:MAG TPA: patatin-like phospholipase family protein [Nitrososphaera sp.]
MSKKTILSKQDKPIRSKHRVLILQGGGALGAYEAGAFRAFYDWLSMQPSRDDENMFDVVAGTSIGAINASIITSYVKERRNAGKSPKASWEGVAHRLEEFWSKISVSPTMTDSLIPYLWPGGFLRHIFPNIASGEAARRYYAAKASMLQGSPGVFSPVVPVFDFKYFDIWNTSFRSSNEPLKRTMKEYIHFPIKTSIEKNEPRLLVITTDVATAEAVVFDSYSNESKIAVDDQAADNDKSSAATNDRETRTPNSIKYEKGLEAEHVLASASVPINFDYQWIPNEYDYENPSNNSYSPAAEKKFRAFWDGGIMSNTPLWEFLISHRAFWINRIASQDSTKIEKYLWLKPEEVVYGRSISKTDLVPNVDVYMINVWPTRIDPDRIPKDYDQTLARQDNIIFGDKTENDQLMAETITDYANLAKEIRQRALDWAGSITNGDPKQEQKLKDLQRRIDELLDKDSNPHRLNESRLRYKDLLLGQFDVDKVHRVERKADTDAIFNMMLDFTTETVQRLMVDGRDDALQNIIAHQMDLLRHYLDLRKSDARQHGTEEEEETAAAGKKHSAIEEELRDIEEELLSMLKDAMNKVVRKDNRSYYADALSSLKSYLERRERYLEQLRPLASRGGVLWAAIGEDGLEQVLSYHKGESMLRD